MAGVAALVAAALGAGAAVALDADALAAALVEPAAVLGGAPAMDALLMYDITSTPAATPGAGGVRLISAAWY